MLPVCDSKSGLEGSVTVTYNQTLGCFSVMVASYERDESCVLKQFMSQ